MVARELDDTERPPRGSIEFLTEGALRERLEEEVNRAARHGTALSCLLLEIADLPALRHAHGELLVERVLAYVELALRRELRRFDRVGRASEGELLVVLPGADLPRGELVARRILARLRSIKLESSGRRHSLAVAVGVAPLRAGMSAEALLGDARMAAQLERSENGHAHIARG
jgi:diguanylate cyclase (GGDEF)-like protein